MHPHPSSSPSFKQKAACFILFILASAVSGHATTLLSIDDLVRPGGTSPNTFVTGTSNAVPTTATLGTGPTTLSYVSKGGNLIANFSQYSLVNIGDEITFTYTATFTNFNSASAGFRLGIFDQATGAKVTGDQGGTTLFTNYHGYGIATRATGATPLDGQIFRKDPAQNTILSPSGAVLLSTTLAPLNTTSGHSYSGSFSLQLTGPNTITITSQFGSQAAVTVMDTAANDFNFNTIAFYTTNSITGSVGSEMDFTQFNVYAVPEPSSFGLAMAGFVGLLLWRRRR